MLFPPAGCHFSIDLKIIKVGSAEKEAKNA